MHYPKFKRILVTLCCFFALCSLRAANYLSGVSPATLPWTGGIVPYVFDSNYPTTAGQQAVILAGLREWELVANVKIIPRTSQTRYVLIQYSNDGSGTGQYLTGTAPKLILHGLSRGLIAHEAGHMLGLQHEQQRKDSTNYIVLHTNNVTTGAVDQFVVDSTSTSFGSYDFESVMHYGPTTFTNGLGDSLDPLPAYQKYYHKIGNLALSIGDQAAATNLYGPPAVALTNVVLTTADGGTNSLRAAIYYANDHPGTTVRFNIPTSNSGYSNGVFTIFLSGELPPLVSPDTVIDATTQPGFSGSPIVTLDGSKALAEVGNLSGLHLYGTNGVARALAFNNFNFSGVQFYCSDAVSNRIEGCYLGVKPDGTNAAPNSYSAAIFQFGANHNFIGGINATQRNIISGNTYYGILVNDSDSDANVILGNYIGLNAAGTAALPNGFSGIGLWFDPADNIIGGAETGAGNVISGNTQYGIYLEGANLSGVVIQGNYIGTDAAGTNALANGYGGIGAFNGVHNITIGGNSPEARNVISGNMNAGILLGNGSVTNNVVQGNYIGLDATGARALGNSSHGVLLFNGAAKNLIGGTTVGAGNVISGNLSEGIYLTDSGTTGNVLQGNYIGTDATGKFARGNASFGLGIWNGARGNLIGGSVAGAGNFISGNPKYGLAIGDRGTSGNFVQGNFLGTDVTGTNALANGYFGVTLQGGATNNFIGGTAPGAGNVIAFNSLAGVVIWDTPTTNNPVRGNSIFSNGGIGIDLNYNGITANDTGDADTGPNNLQNYPVVTNTFGSGATTVVLGRFNSLANRTFAVDFYRNPSATPLGGKIYLGSLNLTTDGNGNATFAYTNNSGNFSGQYLTTTATIDTGDTSEFSAALLATNRANAAVVFTNALSFAMTNGASFSLNLMTNFSYRIQATTNLAGNPIPWVDLTNFTATLPVFNFTDRAATNFPRRFYRVISP